MDASDTHAIKQMMLWHYKITFKSLAESGCCQYIKILWSASSFQKIMQAKPIFHQKSFFPKFIFLIANAKPFTNHYKNSTFFIMFK